MLIKKIYDHLYTYLLSIFFESIGKRTVIKKMTRLDNPKSIRIGSFAYIAKYAWLCGSKKADHPTIVIGNKVRIGHYAHIIGLYNVRIEDSVLIADKVYIADTTHNFENVNISVIDQGERTINEVVIGEGSWLGENVSVLGAKIGKHCIIGTNSFVNCDIPDYSVAVGIPAKVIKKYNFETNKWEKTYVDKN